MTTTRHSSRSHKCQYWWKGSSVENFPTPDPQRPIINLRARSVPLVDVAELMSGCNETAAAASRVLTQTTIIHTPPPLDKPHLNQIAIYLHNHNKYWEQSIKLKLFSSTLWRHVGEEEVELHSFVTPSTHDGGWKISRPIHFTSKKYPGTQRRGWVGPRVSLDTFREEKHFSPDEIRTPDGPARSLVTDYAIPAPEINLYGWGGGGNSFNNLNVRITKITSRTRTTKTKCESPIRCTYFLKRCSTRHRLHVNQLLIQTHH